jgi:superfamily II DNA or RNA helicase
VLHLSVLTEQAQRLTELKAIDIRLQQLETEKQGLLANRQTLLKQQYQSSIHSPSTHSSMTPDQKVEIFAGLFKGRNDIYATRWENAKGRNGYGLACDNEWKSGVCAKPKVKCGECPNQQFKPITKQTIYDHLSGKIIVGLYPLCKDNSAHLLAIDFDKSDWRASIQAISKACSTHQIPHAIEISRSGNGAHLWVFFSEAISAKTIRQLGFFILDKAMDIQPSLSFESYDRLFPNQDTMPDGGFGNLIALPLQLKSRNKGFSLFVDEQLTPHPDQWHFLANIKRFSLNQVLKLIGSYQPANTKEAFELTDPWDTSKPNAKTVIPHCPAAIEVTLANHIYIPTDSLPNPLLTSLKRIASFSNPVFFKTQAMRFSTHGIPRYISCAHIENGYLSLPRGCLDDVISLLTSQKINVTFSEKRTNGQPLNQIKFLGILRDEQQNAVDVMASHDTGILHAPTAFGKTVAAIGLIAKRKVNTLILTHSRQLLDQWKERILSFTSGIDVGVYGGGKKKPTGQIDIATYQSLIDKRDNSISALVREYGQVIIDECHHISAPRYEMVINEINAKYVHGLTATPDRQDGHQKIMFMIAGPVRHKVISDHTKNFTQTVHIKQVKSLPPPEFTETDIRPHIASVYQWIMGNDERNQQIIRDVIDAVNAGRNPLLLTERREHAQVLLNTLETNKLSAVILRGAMRAKERDEANEKLKHAQVIVATGKYIGEGFDLPRLDTLFLTMPISWKGSLTQYAGRIHRQSEGKFDTVIYDYVDTELPMLKRMFDKRSKSYKIMGYDICSSK